MFNKVIMVGNLTRDIELRYLPSGTAVGNCSIATSRRYKNQMGEQKEEVCFVDLSFFGRTAEIANQYLKKGSKILIEGRLRLESWEDQNGQKRNKHSITVENMQMLDSRSQNIGGDSYQHQNSDMQQQQSQQQTQTNRQNNIPEIDINDDEIPF